MHPVILKPRGCEEIGCSFFPRVAGSGRPSLPDTGTARPAVAVDIRRAPRANHHRGRALTSHVKEGLSAIDDILVIVGVYSPLAIGWSHDARTFRESRRRGLAPCR